ncbi:hypothetical protein BKA93DRAFT_750539 [Sparassis latifolia]
MSHLVNVKPHRRKSDEGFPPRGDLTWSAEKFRSTCKRDIWIAHRDVSSPHLTTTGDDVIPWVIILGYSADERWQKRKKASHHEAYSTFQVEVITITVMWVAGVEEYGKFNIHAFVLADVDQITALKSRRNTPFQGVAPSQSAQVTTEGSQLGWKCGRLSRFRN